MLDTPLLFRDQLVGVLTLYSATKDGFSAEDRRLVEDVARQIGGPLEKAAEREGSTAQNILRALPDLQEFEELAEAAGTHHFSWAPRATLLVIEVTNLARIKLQRGEHAETEIWRDVLCATRLHARTSDVLFRRGSDALVVLMDDADIPAAETLGRCIESSVASPSRGSTNNGAIEIRCFVYAVKSPSDRIPLAEVRAVAGQALSTESVAVARTRVH